MPLILKISAVFILGTVFSAHAEKVEKREEARESSTSSASISSSVSNDTGSVKYNDKEVWTGKVRKGLNTVAKSVDGADLAAAWDGRKLVWENVKDAGKKLEPELKELLKKLKQGQR
ncbi:MAG: hypothetical protein HKO57_02110 [Akkermansiaceae bacterium]|nr:hypothetical protein [Akkermansiaceae bacterium]